VASRGTDEHGLRSAALHRLLPAERRRPATLEMRAVRPTRQTDQRPHRQNQHRKINALHAGVSLYVSSLSRIACTHYIDAGGLLLHMSHT